MPRGWYFFIAFLGAFLLFQLELITGQFMLPQYGGGYQIWTACMLFFQCTLLLGYLYADLAPRLLAPSTFMKLHVGLLALSAILMPTAFPERPLLAEPAGDMLVRLLLFMGAPFFLLSATSTVASQAYARTQKSGSPYGVYGWSNLGSAAGLISYPFVFAVAFDQETNFRLWRALFVVFILAGLPLAATAPKSAVASRPVRKTRDGETHGFLWLLLPATSAAALVAATNYINTIAAPMPLTWIFPLLVYLLSYSAYFVENRFAPRILPATLLASAAAVAVLSLVVRAPLGVMIVAVVIAVLALACLLLHRELHALKPAVDDLPHYYLAIAAGSFVGTALITTALPVLGRHAFARYADLDAALALFAASAALLFFPRLAQSWRKYAVAGAALAAVVVVSNQAASGVTNVYSLRNFYGVYQIQDDRALGLRTMIHGGTPHGVQALDAVRRRTPLSYYGANSPIAGVLARSGAIDVGVVGLGVGDLVSYARPGQRWTVFEIDPDVVAMAREHFSFVADSRAPVRMVTGDSRVRLRQEPPASFDVLVLDAFDGANVPFHLLTREALALYRSKLKDGGLLVFHCSSNHFALRPVLAADAAAAGMSAWIKDSEPAGEGARAASSGLHFSEWFAATADPATARTLERAGWTELTPDARDLWTDGYKNVFRAMRFR